jgi:DNA-binding NtrC family response regulator
MNVYKKIGNKKILLVDDDVIMRESLSLLFKTHGCNFKATESAEDAMVEIAHENYDIVISDLRLGGMNGIDFLHQLEHTHPDCIKILMTAYGSEQNLPDVKENKIDDYIKKPLTANDLETCLEGLVGKKKPKQRSNDGEQ